MIRFIRDLAKDKKGVAALEYALLAGLIVLGVAAAASSANVKSNLTAIFTKVGSELSNAPK